ncbi:hypothetical protein B5M09_001598 [Aphanomyces astaci]|nr:hypothetical protein B5M09_001598 [Aphanomyces astaci]
MSKSTMRATIQFCQYAYKTCHNPRTRKNDGDIHKLCVYHRDWANGVQKIYASKRRQRLREQKHCSGTTSNVAALKPLPLSNDKQSTPMDPMDMFVLGKLFLDDGMEPVQTTSTEWSSEECFALCQLLLA